MDLHLPEGSKMLYIIRHGQTEFNRLGMVQGSGVDSELNEVGKKQAKAFYEAYRHIPFKKIYTSQLKRTHQSVSHFIEKGIAWTQLTGLNEISWGHKEGRPLLASDDDQFKQMVNGWRRGDLWMKVPGGESPLEVMERQKAAVRLMMSYENEDCVLICMHGRAMRILLTWLTGRPLEQMDIFPHQNLCLYVLRYENKRFEIEIENDVKHLYY
jgi:probable phosphoglycerate mutase